MRVYKVEFVQITKKYACVTVEASSRREAIAKARNDIDLKDYEETETHTGDSWDAKPTSGVAGVRQWWKSLFG